MSLPLVLLLLAVFVVGASVGLMVGTWLWWRALAEALGL